MQFLYINGRQQLPLFYLRKPDWRNRRHFPWRKRPLHRKKWRIDRNSSISRLHQTKRRPYFSAHDRKESQWAVLSSRWFRILWVPGKKRNRFFQKHHRTSGTDPCPDGRRPGCHAGNSDFWQLYRGKHLRLGTAESFLYPGRFQSFCDSAGTKRKTWQFLSCASGSGYPDKIRTERNGRILKSCILYGSCHRQHQRKRHLHQPGAYSRWSRFLYHTGTRRLSRAPLSDYLLCQYEPCSFAQPLKFWRLHRRMGDLQRDDELLLHFSG